MIHLTSKSLTDHRERAEALSEWQLAFWWMGVGCIVLATSLLLLDEMKLGYLMALIYWPIALARCACGYAIERHVRSVRKDLSGRGEE